HDSADFSCHCPGGGTRHCARATVTGGSFEPSCGRLGFRMDHPYVRTADCIVGGAGHIDHGDKLSPLCHRVLHSAVGNGARHGAFQSDFDFDGSFHDVLCHDADI